MRAPQVDGPLWAITCMRDSLYLSPNDINVLTILNMPLMVGSASEGDDRLLTFELSGGQFRVKVYDGRLSEAERRRTDEAIQLMGFRVLIEEGLSER